MFLDRNMSFFHFRVQLNERRFRMWLSIIRIRSHFLPKPQKELDQFLASYLDKCLKTAIFLKEKNFNQFWFQHGVGWLKHKDKADWLIQKAS